MVTKVLVVDDSGMVRQQVRRALSAAGFTVVEAENGAEALSQLTEHPDVGMVITDVNMPTMTGLEFLERVHEERAEHMPPVVLLTTEGQRQLIERARALGAKGWVVKPFKADLLVAAVRKLTLAARVEAPLSSSSLTGHDAPSR